MPRRASLCLLPCLLWLALALPTRAMAGIPHHELSIRLDPAEHTLMATDRITFDAEVHEATFTLHAGLSPRVLGGGWTLEPVEASPERDGSVINATDPSLGRRVEGEAFRLVAREGASRVVELAYEGVIHHPLSMQAEEYQRGFSETPGLIAPEGVFLAGTSAWVPDFGDDLVTFSLRVSGLEPPWDVVSQGARVVHELDGEGRRSTGWSSREPVEEIYLVAGPFEEYEREEGRLKLRAFLRTPDPALAERYLDATRRYITMYESVLPDYPFEGFALVENFWDTGYGMPGFTLLGERIIRFPFILTSSYPHEILHSWWGNSVYVDAERGNWCEGLTAYMADHLFAEHRGEDALYRRATLKKYADFVGASEDFPLVEFRSRHSAETEAVGYGKSLMLFHMVRRALGDEAFLDVLAGFAQEFRFRRAGFDDLEKAFALRGGPAVATLVDAWSKRSGAPRIEIASATVRAATDAEQPWALELRLRQEGVSTPFPLTLPVLVTLEGEADALELELALEGRDTTVLIPCPARPLRVDVDPHFDAMRRLDPLEVPPALSTLHGADSPLFVLPAGAGESAETAWRALATGWSGTSEPRVIRADELEDWPEGDAWFLGRDNAFAGPLAQLVESQGVSLAGDELGVGEERWPLQAHSVVLVARHPGQPGHALGWIGADPEEAIAGLARKLPHYGKYGWLVFSGDEPRNVGKGLWTPLGSPLTRVLVDGDAPAAAAARERRALIARPPRFDAAPFARTVGALADPRLEGRGLGSDGLERATAIVEGRLRNARTLPLGESFRHSWTWTGGPRESEMSLTNVLAMIPGSNSELAKSPLLVMAHLDHLGRGWPDVRAGNEGAVHPGADDNASGVALALALAEELAASPPRARPVIFAFVTAEEAGRLGSRRLLEELAADGIRPFACVNFDSVGRLGEEALMVLDGGSAREWRFLFMGVQYTTGLPMKIVSEPLDASDQVSCHEQGIPGVQLFTGAHEDYHRPSDTVERVDSEGLARIAESALEAIVYLAEREEPLTVTLRPEKPSPEGSAVPGRRAALGTLPDFGFSGPGVRIEDVLEGSPAAKAGVRPGDLLVAIDGNRIENLRAYSDLLKAGEPGQQVTLTIQRQGETITLDATLGER